MFKDYAQDKTGGGYSEAGKFKVLKMKSMQGPSKSLLGVTERMNNNLDHRLITGCPSLMVVRKPLIKKYVNFAQVQTKDDSSKHKKKSVSSSAKR